MKKILFVVLACGALAIDGAKGAEPDAAPAAPSPAASAADVEALRQQVQSLTELVQTLQKQATQVQNFLATVFHLPRRQLQGGPQADGESR